MFRLIWPWIFCLQQVMDLWLKKRYWRKDKHPNVFYYTVSLLLALSFNTGNLTWVNGTILLFIQVVTRSRLLFKEYCMRASPFCYPIFALDPNCQKHVCTASTNPDTWQVQDREGDAHTWHLNINNNININQRSIAIARSHFQFGTNFARAFLDIHSKSSYDELVALNGEKETL